MKVAILLAVTSACILLSLSGAVADENDLTCMDKPLKRNKEFETNYNKCKEEMRKEKKENKKDRKRGRICREVCKFQKTGILDDKGAPVISKYEQLMAESVPAEAVAPLKGNSTACFEKFKDLKNDPADASCSKDGEFLQCVFKAFAMVCDEDYDEIDWKEGKM